MAHKWAKWLRHPCCLGDPHHFRAGGKMRSGPLVGKVATSPLPSRGSPPLQSGGGKLEVAHLWAKWLRHPCRLGDPHRCRAGGEIRSGPLLGKVATSPLPSRGSPPLQSGGKSEVAHLWAKWLRHPCCLGDPHRCRAGGGKSKSGPLVGKVATSPLPSRGSPPLQSGGGEIWPTYGQSGYATLAVSGIPTASGRGAKSEVAHLWAKWLRHRCRLGDPHRCRAGRGKSEVAHLWGKWLRHPCRLGDRHRCRAGGEIRSGPQVGKVDTSPLPSRRSPPLQSGGGGNQKWPNCGQSGYVTPAVSGIPTAAERGGEIRSGPLVGKVATSPLPSRGSPPLQSGGKIRSGPQVGKVLRHPCRLGDLQHFRAGGGGSEVAHLWAKWLHHPCRLGDPQRFGAGGKIRRGPLVGKTAVSPLPSRGSPPLQSRGGNQKWPTCGQSGYVTPAVSGIPTAAERGGKSEVAHLWAKWIRHPCRLGDPHRFRAGGKIRSGPLMGKVAKSPLPSGDPHRFRAGGGNQKWPTYGQSGYVTPAVSGIPTTSERGGKSEVAHLWAKWLRHPCCLGDPHRCRAGGKSEVAHKWAKWLRHPCRLGDPHRCRAGGKITSGPLVGKVATSPLPSRGSPPLQSGGEIRSGPQVGKVATSPLPSRGSPPLQSWRGNQKWPTSGQSGYVTPAVSGIPTAAERGGKSEVAHKIPTPNEGEGPCPIHGVH